MFSFCVLVLGLCIDFVHYVALVGSILIIIIIEIFYIAIITIMLITIIDAFHVKLLALRSP